MLWCKRLRPVGLSARPAALIAPTEIRVNDSKRTSGGTWTSSSPTPAGQQRLAEQLLCDHDALNLVGAFVGLGGLQRSSASCRLVLRIVAELQRSSDWWWAVLPCDAEY